MHRPKHPGPQRHHGNGKKSVWVRERGGGVMEKVARGTEWGVCMVPAFVGFSLGNPLICSHLVSFPDPSEAHASERGEETFFPRGKGLGTRLVHTAMFVSHPKE